MTLAVLIGVFLILLALGVPVVWALAGATLSVLATGLMPLPPAWFAQEVFRGANTISLVSIPLFLLAGGLMNEGGLTRRIVNVADDFLGWMRGGLGLVNVGTCMVYGGISGSATADTGAVASIMIPAMSERGYPKAYAAAVTAASGTLGIIIPPSVIMIMYGVVTGTSIGGLFVAGIVPGILVAVVFMATAGIIGVRNGFPKSAHQFSVRRLVRNTVLAAPAILMPVVVLGSILTGFATVTEAAFVGVVWATL
ncbi:MAG: TRAP transporter large permease, partial [Dehalococcoidia bacterium]